MRRPRVRSAAALVVVPALLAGCGGSGGDAAAPTPTPTGPTVTTPPASTVKTAPAALTIGCTGDGTTVSSAVVATTPTGVVLRVRNTTGERRVVGHRLTPFGGGAPQLGVLPEAASSKATVFALPPGRLDVRCGRSANSGLEEEATSTIVDRRGYYTSVDVAEVLGCTPRPLRPAQGFTARATREEALSLMAPRLPGEGKVRFVDGPGYSGAATTQHLVLRGGKGFGIATVTLEDNLSYVPRLVARC
jgi:hypothetical protein